MAEIQHEPKILIVEPSFGLIEQRAELAQQNGFATQAAFTTFKQEKL
jgi:uncharacterized MAPEG superfamily protein